MSRSKVVKDASETQIQRSIMEYLKMHPRFGYFYRSNNVPVFDKERRTFRSMPKYCPKGVPDISGVLSDGRACWFEVKKPRTYQSKDQKFFQENVEKYDAIYKVVRSIEDVETFFKEYFSGTENQL